MEIDEKYYDNLCKLCGSDIVFTDVWSNNMDERQLDKNELLPGELSATIFTVGCYTVRCAFRVFKIPEYNEALTENDYHIPADKEDLDYAKKLSYVAYMPKKFKEAMKWRSWRIDELDGKRLHIIHEIKAKYNDAPDKGLFCNGFKYVCQIDNRESIEFICTAKCYLLNVVKCDNAA